MASQGARSARRDARVQLCGKFLSTSPLVFVCSPCCLNAAAMEMVALPNGGLWRPPPQRPRPQRSWSAYAAMPVLHVLQECCWMLRSSDALAIHETSGAECTEDLMESYPCSPVSGASLQRDRPRRVALGEGYTAPLAAAGRAVAALLGAARVAAPQQPDLPRIFLADAGGWSRRPLVAGGRDVNN